jgi:hypothetical protein
VCQDPDQVQIVWADACGIAKPESGASTEGDVRHRGQVITAPDVHCGSDATVERRRHHLGPPVIAAKAATHPVSSLDHLECHGIAAHEQA